MHGRGSCAFRIKHGVLLQVAKNLRRDDLRWILLGVPCLLPTTVTQTHKQCRKCCVKSTINLWQSNWDMVLSCSMENVLISFKFYQKIEKDDSWVVFLWLLIPICASPMTEKSPTCFHLFCFALMRCIKNNFLLSSLNTESWMGSSVHCKLSRCSEPGFCPAHGWKIVNYLLLFSCLPFVLNSKIDSEASKWKYNLEVACSKILASFSRQC